MAGGGQLRSPRSDPDHQPTAQKSITFGGLQLSTALRKLVGGEYLVRLRTPAHGG